MHINLILADIHFNVNFHDGASTWNGIVSNLYTGKTQQVCLSLLETHAIVTIAVHPDGEPSNVQDYYDTLSDAIARYGWDGANKDLSPIP